MTGPGLSAALARGRAVLRLDVREGVARDGALLLLGHLIRLGLGLVGSAVVARALGPERLGTLAVAAAATMIAATVADAGLTGSVIRHIARDLPAFPERAHRSAGAYALLRLLGGLTACSAALAFARPAADLLGWSPAEGPALVRIGGLAVLATAASGTVTNLLHAQRRFRAVVVAQSSTTVATVALLLALLLLDRLSVASVLAAGAGASLVGMGAALLLLPRDWRAALRPRAGGWMEEGGRLLSFGRWLWVAAVLSIAFVHLDLLLVNRWLEPRTIGFFALASALALKADTLNQVLHMLLLPAASSLRSRPEYLAYGRRSLGRSLVLAAPLVLCLPLAGPFVAAVYGPEYAPAVPVFHGLVLVVLFDLLVSPVLLLAFPMGLPHLVAVSDAARVTTLAAAGALLIPAYGMFGAVAARFAAKVVGAVVIGTPIGLRLRGGTPAPLHPRPDRRTPWGSPGPAPGRAASSADPRT